MEELRTTEALDREILEDARKKAHRALKTADETLGAKSRSWEKKTQRALDSIRKTYAERIKKNQDEILARLPLDKRRLRSETAEGFLVEAMDKYLNSLEREKLLSVLEDELSMRLEACDVNELSGASAGYSDMSLEEARAVLGRVFGSVDKFLSVDEDLSAAHKFPSITINTRAMKLSASVETAAAALLNEKRSELAAVLLGEGVLND